MGDDVKPVRKRITGVYGPLRDLIRGSVGNVSPESLTAETPIHL